MNTGVTVVRLYNKKALWFLILVHKICHMNGLILTHIAFTLMWKKFWFSNCCKEKFCFWYIGKNNLILNVVEKKCLCRPNVLPCLLTSLDLNATDAWEVLNTVYTPPRLTLNTTDSVIVWLLHVHFILMCNNAVWCSFHLSGNDCV